MLMHPRSVRALADEISVHQDGAAQPSNEFMDPISFFGCSNSSLVLSPSSLPLSGKCNFFLPRACLCCRDLQRPQELPVFARADRASVNGHVNQAWVSHVERGGAAADLSSSSAQWHSLVVLEQHQAASTGPQGWQGTAGAQYRSLIGSFTPPLREMSECQCCVIAICISYVWPQVQLWMMVCGIPWRWSPEKGACLLLLMKMKDSLMPVLHSL